MNLLINLAVIMLITLLMFSPLYIGIFIVRNKKNYNVDASVEILSMISSIDTNCNIETTFAILEDNNML